MYRQSLILTQMMIKLERLVPMKSALHQKRYRLKKKYFDPFPLHMVSKTSPVKSMSDEQWNQLVEV
jgi:hypothetical protein